MDTLTHALSGALLSRLIRTRAPAVPALAGGPAAGAATGRFSAAWDHAPGHTVPWQAVVAGTVAAAFPDIDAVSQLVGEFTYLRHHRGITHSVLLAPLWAWLLAWLLAQCFARTRAQAGGWKGLYAHTLGGVLIHIAGDWITQFGTMLLAPLSDARFGLGAVFIIDLVFSGILIAGLLLAALQPRRRWPAAAGLAAASLWVVVAWVGKQEAEAAGHAHARAQGLAVQWIETMPRPASPFNWTVTVFDGRDYHIAHINTRRLEPLVVGPDDFFIRRFSAPYQPVAQALWARRERFGGVAAPDWVGAAWSHESLATFRWFAQVPALALALRRDNERCAVFHDLRFEFPGRSESPFRYAVCLGEGGRGRVLRVDGTQWRAL